MYTYIHIQGTSKVPLLRITYTHIHACMHTYIHTHAGNVKGLAAPNNTHTHTYIHNTHTGNVKEQVALDNRVLAALEVCIYVCMYVCMYAVVYELMYAFSINSMQWYINFYCMPW